MTKETADRLVECRKNAGYSQEELADAIGVSRQAVSKWERCESSPDTDNLIALARLYHISLDELVSGGSIEVKARSEVAEQAADFSWEDDGMSVDIKDGEISVKNEDGEEKTYDEEVLKKKKRRAKKVNTLVSSIYVLLVTIAYLTLGFCLQDGRGWSCGWTLYLLLPFVSSVVEFIYFKRLSSICYPAIVTFIYCGVGMLYGIWHPTWVMFVTVPVYYIITDRVDRLTRTRDYEAIEDAIEEKNNKKEK